MRTPHDIPLWAVTGGIARLLIALWFRVAADDSVAVSGLAPISLHLLQHAVLCVGGTMLVYLFALSL